MADKLVALYLAAPNLTLRHLVLDRPEFGYGFDLVYAHIHSDVVRRFSSTQALRQAVVHETFLYNRFWFHLGLHLGGIQMGRAEIGGRMRNTLTMRLRSSSNRDYGEFKIKGGKYVELLFDADELHCTNLSDLLESTVVTAR